MLPPTTIQSTSSSTYLGEYIYLVQLREHVRSREYIYKIGRTAQQPMQRIAQYPKGSKLFIIIIVNDSVTAETDLLRLFRSKYISHTELGAEYFEGNPRNMIRDIYDYWFHHFDLAAERERVPSIYDVRQHVDVNPVAAFVAVESKDQPKKASSTLTTRGALHVPQMRFATIDPPPFHAAEMPPFDVTPPSREQSRPPQPSSFTPPSREQSCPPQPSSFAPPSREQSPLNAVGAIIDKTILDAIFDESIPSNPPRYTHNLTFDKLVTDTDTDLIEFADSDDELIDDEPPCCNECDDTDEPTCRTGAYGTDGSRRLTPFASRYSNACRHQRSQENESTQRKDGVVCNNPNERIAMTPHQVRINVSTRIPPSSCSCKSSIMPSQREQSVPSQPIARSDSNGNVVIIETIPPPAKSTKPSRKRASKYISLHQFNSRVCTLLLKRGVSEDSVVDIHTFVDLTKPNLLQVVCVHVKPPEAKPFLMNLRDLNDGEHDYTCFEIKTHNLLKLDSIREEDDHASYIIRIKDLKPHVFHHCPYYPNSFRFNGIYECDEGCVVCSLSLERKGITHVHTDDCPITTSRPQLMGEMGM